MSNQTKGEGTIKFKNIVVIVTGGSSKIGKATVVEFAKEGAKVIISDIQVDNREALATTLNEQGYKTLFMETDISVKEDVCAFFHQTGKHFGKLASSGLPEVLRALTER